MWKKLFVLLLFALTPALKAQFAAVQSDEIFTRLENDSALLVPDENLRGTYRWQKSTDSINWTYVESNLSGDTLAFVPVATEAYRLEIKEGTCMPLYGDIIKVFSKHTTLSEYLFAGVSGPDLQAAGISVSDLLAAGASAIDTFTFLNNGEATKGKIFLPASYTTDKNLPAIFLIDYTEQHFPVVRDEFEKVIEGVQQLEGFDALVVSLENIPDIDALLAGYQEHYETYKNMASYVDGRYTNNTSRTFIGKGSEGGIVLMTLFLESTDSLVFENFIVSDPDNIQKSKVRTEIKNDTVPIDRPNCKLHFSFSESNDRSQCIELINTINEAQYPWLQFESIEYANSNYNNTYPIAFAAGIKFVFGE